MQVAERAMGLPHPEMKPFGDYHLRRPPLFRRCSLANFLIVGSSANAARFSFAQV